MTDSPDKSAGISVPSRQLMSCGDTTCELLVDPIPRPTPEPITITLKPKQARVTLVDHQKPNSMKILKMDPEKIIDMEENLLDEAQELLVT